MRSDQAGYYIVVPRLPETVCAGCDEMIVQGTERVGTNDAMGALLGRQWRHWHPDCWAAEQVRLKGETE